MKMKFLTLFGALGGLITSLFGGWDAAYDAYFTDGAVFDQIYGG